MKKSLFLLFPLACLILAGCSLEEHKDERDHDDDDDKETTSVVTRTTPTTPNPNTSSIPTTVPTGGTK
jgi:outer membrane biogenesis lipoprotein LolB